MRYLLIFSLFFFPFSLCANTIDKKKPSWEQVQIAVGMIPDLQFERSKCLFAVPRCTYEVFDSAKESLDMLSNADTIHIRGDLTEDLVLGEHSELVIQGHVAPNAHIFVNGIADIFVGGNLDGQVLATSSLKISVLGDITGKIETGSPGIELTVHGDFIGNINQTENVNTGLHMRVQGFISKETIRDITEAFFHVRGAFSHSDHASGIFAPDFLKQNHYYTVDNGSVFKGIAQTD